MALEFKAEALLAAQDIRVAFFDVDGVLTDGGVYFSEQGETLKRFSILDGYGLKLLRAAGITPAVITGRDSKPLRVRLQALGIEHVRYGTENKLPAAEAMLAALGLDRGLAARGVLQLRGGVAFAQPPLRDRRHGQRREEQPGPDPRP